MSARLLLASRWMPRVMMAREVERIRARTNATLDTLMTAHGVVAPPGDGRTGRSLEERRAAMALEHERRVRALVEALGREKAVTLGREALFRTGLELGREARERLGVRDDREDLLRAAKVLYRILGIEFAMVGDPDGERMEVSRCALSHLYSEETCLVLSAVDEGVVSGLVPGASMRFEKRLTDGSPRCVAAVRLEGR